MRCQACDRNLSDFESTRKDSKTGEFIDLCNQCAGIINEDLSIDDREDLRHGNDEFEE
tara:strand:+ start:520 stop:693 length:174 start_codon:yes stop_codon:yes gene_type:complete